MEMGTKIKNRNSGIELLRILAACGVIILHYNYNRAFNYVEIGSINYYVLLLLEAIWICAVNLFVAISGYFLCTSNKRSAVKPLYLILQVILFNFVSYFVRVIMGNTDISVKHILACLLPANYFVILYIVVYIISPYINVLLKKLTAKQFKNLVLILLIVFSLEPTLVDVMEDLTHHDFHDLCTIGKYGSGYGYTIVNFLLMYIIGSYIRMCNIAEKFSRRSVIFCTIPLWLVIVIWWFGQPAISISYCNPLVIILACAYLLLFLKLHFKNSMVNELASASFTCFLIHSHILRFLSKEELSWGIQAAVNSNIFYMLLHILLTLVSSYVISYLIYKAYNLITKPIFKYLNVLFEKIHFNFTLIEKDD